MPITGRRLRLSRHVHAPYTTKGKEKCTSTDTPRACIRNPIQSGQMLSIWLCILLGFFSNLSHWSSVYHSLLLGGPLQNRHKHRSCDRTDGKQESFSSGSTDKHLTIWRDNVRKTFSLLEGMSVSFWYCSVWAHDWRSPRWLRLPPLLVLMELRSEVCFWRKSAGWLQLSVDIPKQIFFSFYCGKNKYGALYSQNTCKIKHLLVLQGCSGAASCHSPWS